MLVKDSFRKNKLSLTPGGETLTAVLNDGKKISYDKIKNVDAYCSKMIKDLNIMEIWCEGELLWKRNQ